MTETTTTQTIARPVIDFSGESRRTAREYAAAANSRVLTADSQRVLNAAAQGRTVDAYALNAAITDAMRSCSTRLGQSMARRDLNRKVAYLGHICQAVLENHADGLPVYENSGVRSRKIEELSLEIEHAGMVNQSLAADLTKEREARTQAQNHYLGVCQQVENQDRRIADLIREKTEAEVKVEDLQRERSMLTQAASDERRRLCREIDLNRAVLMQADEVLAAASERLDAMESSRDEVGSVLLYALEFLPADARQRVFGYWDGIQA